MVPLFTNNVKEFAESIAMLLDEKDKAQYVAEKARQTLGELYEWKVLAKGIAVIYDMLIEGDFEA